MTKPRLVRYEVVRESPGVWVMHAGRLPEGEWLTLLRTELGEWKTEFVRRCAAHCRFHATAERPISLRIHGLKEILEERTYPKSADPRRSKG